MTAPGWRRAIASWLEANRGSVAPPGIPVEEARRSAEGLAARISRDRAFPDDFTLDDSGKDVIYALIELLERPRLPIADRADLAEHVGSFLRGLSWPDDALGERELLLRACDSITRSGTIPPGAYSLPEPGVHVLADASDETTSPSAHLDDAAMLRFASKEMTPQEREAATLHFDSCEICSASAAALAAFRAKTEEPDL